MFIRRTIFLLGCVLISGTGAMAQGEIQDVVKRFAPVLVQEQPHNPKLARFDSPTRVDFAGDFDASKNWERASRYPLPAYVYSSLVETETHYFIIYCFFYPRDWKGNLLQTKLVNLFHTVAYAADPTRVLTEIAFSHENDFEGVLVVAAKYPTPRVIAAESLAHSHLRKFVTEDFLADHPKLKGVGRLYLADERPLIVAESKGHGNVSLEWRNPKRFRIFMYAGAAEDPEKTDSREVGYDLLDMKSTFWDMSEPDASKFFSKRRDYSNITVPFLSGDKVKRARIEKKLVGTNMRGHVGANNAARLPWKWEGITWREILRFRFRRNELHNGRWFFDPAKVIGKHFNLNEKEFSRVYISHPYVVSSDDPKQASK